MKFIEKNIAASSEIYPDFESWSKRLSKYLILQPQITYDFYQFKSLVRRVEIKIPNPGDKDLIFKPRGDLFWADQDAKIDINTFKECSYNEVLKDAQDSILPDSLCLLHFYPSAAGFSNILNDYEKNNIKLYFVACLLKFIDNLKTENFISSSKFEFLTNERFQNFLLGLGFKELGSSTIEGRLLKESVVGAKATREELFNLEPLLQEKLKKYYRIRKLNKQNYKKDKNLIKTNSIIST